MGNVVIRKCCCGVLCSTDRNRQRYIRANYTEEQDFSIEFENLIDQEPQNESTRLLTDREHQLLKTRQFGMLVHEQRKADADLEAKVAEQEKEIEKEEAAFLEAKRVAAQVAKLNKDKEMITRNNNHAWVNNEEWEIAADVDEFENFLASVKARSLTARTQAAENGTSPQQSPAQLPVSNQTQSVIPAHSNDFDWDPDFVSAQDDET